MAAFLLSLLTVLVAGLGSRDQMLVATFAGRWPGRGAALIVSLLCAAASAAAIAWLAMKGAPAMPAQARLMFAALALAIAGLELLIIGPARGLNEPTESLGAFALVLLAQQLTDASRFLLFAIAVASGTIASAGLGGAVGAVLVVLLGWFGHRELQTWPLLPLRRALGAVLLVLALALGWSARG